MPVRFFTCKHRIYTCVRSFVRARNIACGGKIKGTFPPSSLRLTLPRFLVSTGSLPISHPVYAHRLSLLSTCKRTIKSSFLYAHLLFFRNLCFLPSTPLFLPAPLPSPSPSPYHHHHDHHTITITITTDTITSVSTSDPSPKLSVFVQKFRI